MCVPLEGAANHVDCADLLATARIIAACGFVSHIAAAKRIGATGHENRAHRPRLARAGVIPLHDAAESVHRANIIAASEVITTDGRVCSLAGARSRIAARALRESTVRVRCLCAMEVPAIFAAELIECADEFAASRIAAVGACMFVAATACVRVSAIRTELQCPIDADLIPGCFAAMRIDHAHGRAAIRITAAGSLMRNLAAWRTRRAATHTHRVG